MPFNSHKSLTPMAKIKRIQQACGLYCAVNDVSRGATQFSIFVLSGVALIAVVGGGLLLTQEAVEMLSVLNMVSAGFGKTFTLLLGAACTARASASVVSFAEQTLQRA